ncbi:hypothetical protein HZP70_00435 [Elizabethkingia anophelis]|uniref:hypothetical protein n=1 Tax=Elizabethkingia anophelis TaxID=1117645 RepID=UPI0021A5FB69|nr:hypothetical protein [Elizabethkingia anophelis]MCT3825331.1 hypothetical protein [Elizabethkingia anophelis]MCT3836173.1 hypothetical protein [Elizabethkingia anophelis]MCT3839653.1 hypothetical protein [Elizabethkingia anophelis]MCT3846977.1 hypothetical protein [Elizabethkingia anophelis]
MAIKRNNILSLIGNGRYHSCVLTTFSFDFYFFEMKVMKWLRSCGIRNVNVFIDGHFYSELMQQATGDEMKLATGYSLYPVFEKSIFHPKVWFLFGENEGLLLVGSGNLTNSGNGSNDEIWGAYHFDIKQPQNAPVFSTAWNYVSKLSSTTKGITSEKTTRWIAEHSQWLMELPKVADFRFLNLPNNEQAAFLYNTEQTNIWQQVKQLTANESVIEITTVSPYYDTKGKALEEIKGTFPDAQINVVIDEYGTIPTELPNEKNYAFYDWKELDLCRNIGAKQQSKLHAKILHFKTKDNKEFCLFGSANITSAGLGISNSANAEVSLFIKSEKGNILEKIGLKLKGNSKKALSKFTANNKISIEQAIIRNNQFPIKLLAAEINYSTLTLYTNKGFDKPVSISIYDSNNQFIKTQKIELLKPQHEISLDIDENKFRYVQVQSTDGNNILSNKIIVSDYFTIVKTHPNPKNAELEKLCGQLQSGELRNVLDLIHYAIIDESEKEDGASIINTSKNKLNEKEEKKTADQSQLYDLSGYKPIEPNSQLHENALLLSPSLHVLDALKLAHTQSLDLEADIRADEQEEDISNISGNNENEVRKEKSVPLKILQTDKRKLKKYFKNLYGYFHHDLLFKDTNVSDYKLTLTDITKYLIALELIHEFGGKSEKIEDEQQQLFFTYLPVTGDYESDNVKGCCINIVGDFLRLSKNGFKKYTFDYTRKKFEQLQRDVLISTIVCIVNVNWKEDEKPYLKTLLLNALHYLGWASTKDIDKNLNILIQKVREKAKNLKQATRNLGTQLDYFDYQVCNAFRHSTQNRESGRFADKASKGQIIYSSIAGIGYCYVVSATKKNEYCLARPGFNWNEQEKEFLNHFGDNIYAPLPLMKMTIIDL